MTENLNLLKTYNVILADPPWSYRDKAKAGNRGSSCHYETMTDQQIRALPVPKITANDCALFLWATAPRLPEAIWVMEAWGFEYKTVAFVWEKITMDGWPAMGLGHWTRANAEFVLLGVRGKPQRQNAGVPQIVRARRREHSRKPEVVHDRIVQLFGDLPRCELFARRPVAGWDVWGNEVDSDFEL
jgi:N6-adenosine-specific RNA methylase IME4